MTTAQQRAHVRDRRALQPKGMTMMSSKTISLITVRIDPQRSHLSQSLVVRGADEITAMVVMERVQGRRSELDAKTHGHTR